MPDPVSLVAFGAPMLPDPARLVAITARARAAGWLTNSGVLHMPFELARSTDQAVGDAVSLTSSGTMALTLALIPGNLPAVTTTPLTIATTAQAIAGLELVPVFADVEPVILTLCPRAVGRAITPRTAALLPVHFLGVPCDATALADIASRHGLWLGHDAAHAFDHTFNGQPIGHDGDASAFSLLATKLLHTAKLVLSSSLHEITVRCYAGRAGHGKTPASPPQAAAPFGRRSAVPGFWACREYRSGCRPHHCQHHRHL